MGTATRVPVTHDMTGDELSADEALVALRRYGRWPCCATPSYASVTPTASATPARWPSRRSWRSSPW